MEYTDMVRGGRRMITDDERREVARKLRGIEGVLFSDGKFVDCGEVENALGIVPDENSYYREEDIERLADLIEPERTCPECGRKLVK